MPDLKPSRAFTPDPYLTMAVTVDAVILVVRDEQLHVLLTRRQDAPALSELALPGVFVRADEDLDDAARRAVRAKAGVQVPVRQFRAFGAVHRDPRGRIISIGYIALVVADQLAEVLDDDHQLVPVDSVAPGGGTGESLTLPFDHADIIQAAHAYLRADLDTSGFSFGLLPKEFTLRELQKVHEAVRGERVNKPAFRKRLLDSGKLAGTGRRDVGGPFRPAELYRVVPEAFA